MRDSEVDDFLFPFVNSTKLIHYLYIWVWNRLINIYRS